MLHVFPLACPSLQQLLAFRGKEDAGGDEEEEGKVCQGEGFRDEDLLKRRPVDHEHLSDEGASDGDEERLVAQESDLEDGLGLRATAQGIEHVKQDEAGERHRRVSRSHDVVAHLCGREKERGDAQLSEQEHHKPDSIRAQELRDSLRG